MLVLLARGVCIKAAVTLKYRLSEEAQQSCRCIIAISPQMLYHVWLELQANKEFVTDFLRQEFPPLKIHTHFMVDHGNSAVWFMFGGVKIILQTNCIHLHSFGGSICFNIPKSKAAKESSIRNLLLHSNDCDEYCKDLYRKIFNILKHTHTHTST